MTGKDDDGTHPSRQRGVAEAAPAGPVPPRDGDSSVAWGKLTSRRFTCPSVAASFRNVSPPGPPPAAATTSAAAVEMLNVPRTSPPVPQVSSTTQSSPHDTPTASPRMTPAAPALLDRRPLRRQPDEQPADLCLQRLAGHDVHERPRPEPREVLPPAELQQDVADGRRCGHVHHGDTEVTEGRS